MKLRLASHGIFLVPPAAYSALSHGGTLWDPTGTLTSLAGTSPGQITLHAPGMESEQAEAGTNRTAVGQSPKPS